MADRDAAPGARAARVGLCARCRHHREQPTRRGTIFSRCARAETEPEYPRYPPLPVRLCRGFEAAGPG